MTAPAPTPSTDHTPAGGLAPADAARLCWHTARLCDSLDRGIAQLQDRLAEATEHADAILELALTLADVGAAEPDAVETAGEGGS